MGPHSVPMAHLQNQSFPDSECQFPYLSDALQFVLPIFSRILGGSMERREEEVRVMAAPLILPRSSSASGGRRPRLGVPLNSLVTQRQLFLC